jgi:acetylornithine deacetylase/succinyl-diaminopimelate desuccinylase-like protein
LVPAVINSIGSAASTVTRKDVEQLARGLVRIPSYTTEEEPLAEFIAEYMKSIGLDATLQEVPLAATTRSFNVIGKIEGEAGGPSLMFTGHMDHAPALGRNYDDLSRWKRPPFDGVIEGDWLYGKGSQDEKGGICAMLIAAKAILESGVKPAGDLYFVPVQGHKRVSSGTRHLLGTGFRTDYAVNTENSGNALVPRWVGRAEGRFVVRARAGGRELHFHLKEVDPKLTDRRSVFEQTRSLLEALGSEMAPPESTGWMTFQDNPGLPGYPQYRIERIETRSQMHVDVDFQIRVVPGQTEQSLREDLQRLLDTLRAADPHFDAELQFPTAQIRSAVDLPDDDPLVTALSLAHKHVTGTDADVSASGRLGAAADASVLMEHGIKTVIYGPGGGMSDVAYQQAVHEGRVPPDERISIPSIVTAANVYALAAASLAR